MRWPVPDGESALSVGRIPPQALGELPAGVTAHAHVDQLAVLSRSSLFITHGGFNGVQEALIAGVPMLLFPQMQEQALNTARVGELGAGLRLRRATPGQITAKTDLILTASRFRDAAIRAGTELRRAIDMDGAVAAVVNAGKADS